MQTKVYKYLQFIYPLLHTWVPTALTLCTFPLFLHQTREKRGKDLVRVHRFCFGLTAASKIMSRISWSSN